MSPTNPTSKSRTVALPKMNKNLLTGQAVSDKNQVVEAALDNMWNGMVFGPYLVPLSRRAE